VSHVVGQARIERAQTRSKHPAVGLSEEHGYTTAKTRELISVGVREFHNQALTLEPAQIIRGLTCGVGCGPKRTNSLDYLTVAKTSDEMAEPDQSSQHRHHPCFAETKSCGIETIVRGRRLGHPAKGGHIGSGLSVGGFGVTQTPVGRFTNRPEGIPVQRADTATDSEVMGITDDRFGSQRPSLFSAREVLLHL